jgi:hypothetical protein
MVELRWFSSDNKQRRLQYRQKIDTTVRAGMWANEDIVKTANYEWSDWSDVPEVYNAPNYGSNRCPTCGLEFSGSMGYVCPNVQCPTGLGGSRS